MSIEINVPTLGESISEATIGKWHKKIGDFVKVDEPLVELETDKVTLEVNAPSSGVLLAINANEGEAVTVGAVLGAIDPAQEAKAAPAAVPAPAKATQTPPPSPAAAKIAADRAIAVSEIAGSGKRGQVIKEDVLGHTPAAPASGTAQQAGGQEERVKMSKLRQTIARRLKEAQNNAAMLTTFNEVDMTQVMAIRARFKDSFERKHGHKLGFMSLFVKACVQALKEIPSVNAQIDGNDIIYKNYYHIGIAVGTDKGLVVPVVRDADKLSAAGIERKIADFGKRARDGQLKIDEMQGATFTITNGGVYGSLMSTPILNAPQSGILGMHKIQDRPVAVDGRVEIRPMMYLALSYDHRLIDGKEAVTFLVRVKEALEDPVRLVLDL